MQVTKSFLVSFRFLGYFRSRGCQEIRRNVTYTQHSLHTRKNERENKVRIGIGFSGGRRLFPSSKDLTANICARKTRKRSKKIEFLCLTIGCYEIETRESQLSSRCETDQCSHITTALQIVSLPTISDEKNYTAIISFHDFQI